MGRLHRIAMVFAAAVLLTIAAAGAKQARHRVVAVVDTGLGLVLGGSVDGKWTDDARVARLLRGGERYRLYTLTKRLGPATGTKPEFAPHDGYVDAHLVKLKPEPEEDCIAIQGEWEALPRTPKVERTDQRLYQDAVRSAAKRKGIRDPVVHISQVLRVDLEGDGVEEVLISAASRAGDRLLNVTEKGDYSLVLLRKVISGKPTTVVIRGEFQSTVPPADQPPSVGIHLIKGVLDANGDGIQEVFVSSRYYESDCTAAYTVGGTAVAQVFWQGVGA